MASSKRGGDKPKNDRTKNDAAHFEEDPPRASDTNGHGNNSAARAKALDEALQKFYALQKEEDALLVKYIDPIRERKRDIKSDLKKDYEIPTKAFNARAGLYIVERDDEDEIVLAVNEMFKATPVGSNLDLIALHERVEKKRAEKAAAKIKATATEEAVA